MSDLQPTQVWDKRGFMTTRSKNMNAKNSISSNIKRRIGSIISNKKASEVDDYFIDRGLPIYDSIKVSIRTLPSIDSDSHSRYEVEVSDDEEIFACDTFASAEEAEADRDDKIRRITTREKSKDYSDSEVETMSDELSDVMRKKGLVHAEYSLGNISDLLLDNSIGDISRGYSEYEIHSDVRNHMDRFFRGYGLSEKIISEAADAAGEYLTNKLINYV